MVILKKVYEAYHKEVILKDEIDNLVFDFINEEDLDGKGWINSLLEGGFMSPDGSTIYYYARSPYEGQLMQFNRDSEGFNKIKEHYLKDGRFITV